MWALELQEISEQQTCVLVTVAAIAGSAPRATGSRMLVTSEGFRGSIGGGNLEYKAIASARELIEEARAGYQRQELYGLGPELNQCCGGAVTLLYEVHGRPPPGWLSELAISQLNHQAVQLITSIDAPAISKWLVRQGGPVPGSLPTRVMKALQTAGASDDPAASEIETDEGRFLVETIRRDLKPLFLFGAGHVGTALAEALRPLPFEVTWLDSRTGQFGLEDREKLRMIECADPTAEVRTCPPHSIYVVMTHSHELDEDICHQVMLRGDAAWLGLIGSVTKRRRFVHRLGKRGIPPGTLEQLVCPIGLPGITGKRPATIAVAVAAQLLREVVPEAWR
jgi:xanthine dehydrogenase accessory factor